MKDNFAETVGITKTRVLREYEKIAFASIAHLHNTWIELKDFAALTDDQKACIKSIQSKRQKIADTDIETEWVKVELHSKEAALKGIREMCGFDAPIKMEHAGSFLSFLMKTNTVENDTGKSD